MDATIAPLSCAVADYIAAFDLAAVCQYRDGRLAVARDPAGAAAVWWCEAVKAGPVVRAARRHNGDIPAAAWALGIALTDHATVLARQACGREDRGRHGLGAAGGSRWQSVAAVHELPAGDGTAAARDHPRWRRPAPQPVAIVREVFDQR
jgi:hypothetical protein